MLVRDIVSVLQRLSPEHLQESYDNAGLICGDPSMESKGVMVCLDSTEEVVDDAMERGCNLIIAHHPIIFKGLKSLTGRNYVERTVIKAIKNDIAIYAAHTNLDNVQEGVNRRIGEMLGVDEMRILAPKKGILRKLVTFCPDDHAESVRNALFESGAGHIGNYDSCSFNLSGSGTFRGGEDSTPFVGNPGELHKEPEVRIETIYESFREKQVLKALTKSHPYEEVAYDIYPLDNEHLNIGSGMIGHFGEAMEPGALLEKLKESFKANGIRHTKFMKDKVQNIAWCGGAGSFLTGKAINSGADVFITGDIKYHEFFDAEDRITLIDIGHYESEQFTMHLMAEKLKEKFPTFAVHLTKVKTNPVIYY